MQYIALAILVILLIIATGGLLVVIILGGLLAALIKLILNHIFRALGRLFKKLFSFKKN